ncbi:MAG: hypothetical protein JSW73_03280 [Candidatus Woesearchaeota archaeon]|nr:MAG: hypothetical protein JSW73_03280 [Candidatus Woesearchaeota archaeon]
MKPRAEDYTLEELETLRPISQDFVDNLVVNLTSYNKRYPKYLLAPKGIGKTFHIRKALSNIAKDKSNPFPVMFIYKKSNKIEALDPEKIATKETWGERFDIIKELYQKNSVSDLLNYCNPIIIDDIHYMGDSIVEGTLEPKKFENLLQGTIYEANRGKNIMLVSEAQLSHYLDKAGIKTLDDVLLKFGEVRPSKSHSTKSKEEVRYLRDSKNYLSKILFPKFKVNQFGSLFEDSNVRVDDFIVTFFYNNSDRSPRSLVNFVNEFENSGKMGTTTIWTHLDGEKEVEYISYETFADLAKEKLVKKGCVPNELLLYSVMMEEPVLDNFPHPTYISRLLQKYGRISGLSDKVSKPRSGFSEEDYSKKLFDICVQAIHLKDKFKDKLPEDWLDEFVWNVIPEAYVPVIKKKDVFGNVNRYPEYNRAGKKLHLEEPFKIAFEDSLYSGTYLPELVKVYNKTTV